jgi:AcrR family transcriptional regulator
MTVIPYGSGDRRQNQTVFEMKPPSRPPTKWGDREQRRVDILDAARTRIERGSYLSLNMRDLAADAGLSPATLYSYFATKEELFVTLYVEAIRRYTAEIRPGCETATALVGLLEHVLRGYLELYRAYGRHFTLWSALRADADVERGPFPRELIVELRAVSLENSRLVARAVRRTAADEGLRIVGGEVGAAFLWSTLNGVADHLTSERSALDNFESERLIPFAAQRLARALTDPA